MIEFEFSEVTLSGTAQKLQDLRPYLLEAGALMQRRFIDNIQAQRDFEGNPLTPLAASTLRQKAAQGQSLQILRRDGGLLASLAYQITGPTSVSVGTSLEYAPYVILGTDPYQVAPGQRTLRFKVGKGGKSRFAKKKKANFEQDVQTRGHTHPGLPRRQIIGISPKDAQDLQQLLTRYLEGKR